jgi:hypothetical protein
LKKYDFIFWFILGLIALFYIFKGNDIYKEKYETIKQKSEINKKD